LPARSSISACHKEIDVRGGEPTFLRWLALAALADWLVTRTLARAAIFMPKAPPVLAVYQVLILGGQVASVLGALLALLGMGWLAWHFRKERKPLLPLVLIGLSLFSLVSLAIPPGGLLQMVVHLLNVVAILWIGSQTWRRASRTAARIAWLLPVLALLSGGLYQTSQIVYEVFRLPDPPGFALVLFNLGELFVVLTPLGMWWAYRTQRHDGPTIVQIVGRSIGSPRRFDASPLLAIIPAIGFAAFTLANPSMAGIMAIWSTGLTLYLPWPLYALSLWLFGGTLLALWRQGSPSAWGLLLLAAGGYAPQLSSQVFYGLIGLSFISSNFLQSELPISSEREVVLSQAGYVNIGTG
jgi:hypothetical protein